MQIFLIGALAVALLAVVFAVQNTGAVTVAFIGWTFQGSLALVLFVAFVAGALASFLASVPAMVRGRMATGQHRKELAALQADLAACEQRLQERGGPRPLTPEPRPGPAGDLDLPSAP
jgi:lipopolysaccharide assembly protein A